MTIEILSGMYAVCRLECADGVDLSGGFASLTITDNEISLVCDEGCIPDGAKAETGWRAMRVAGTLEFSLVGILAKISGVLAEADVSIFAVSTFDTDYLLVKDDALDRAKDALSRAGYMLQ